MTGKVKWFDSKKGFGFITPDDGSEELFVHHTGIHASGYRTLETGQPVKYRVEPNGKGPRAVAVKPLAPASAQPLTT